MAEPVRARRLSDQEGRRLLQIVRRGKHGSVRVRRAMIIMASGTLVPAIRRWARRENAGLCFTPVNASWANPIEAQSGPLRTFVMGGSDHRNHPALARKLQDYLRWRNANARHPGVPAAQRRERARLRSERQQRWGRPKPKAA
jgi:hypothetical protein